MNELTVKALELEIPAGDFYSANTQKKINEQIEKTNGLVYPITPEGEAAMKADATAINGFAFTLDKTAAAIYKACTEAATSNRDLTKAQVKALKDRRAQIIAQFEEARAVRAKLVADTMQAALVAAWDEKKVQPQYRQSVIGQTKDSMLTSTGVLTASAKRFIEELSLRDLNWQTEITNRGMHIELECRRNGIDTPFSPEYIGAEFTAYDPNVFYDKLALLIMQETKRMEAVREKIAKEEREKAEREQAAIRNAEIAKAIENGREQARLEQEQALTEKKPTSVDYFAEAKKIRELAFYSDKAEYRQSDLQEAARLEAKGRELEAMEKQAMPEPQAQPQTEPEPQPEPTEPGKRIITLTATFRVTVSATTPDEKILDFFKGQLPEKLTSALQAVHVD